MYVKSSLAGSTSKVPDKSDEEDLEMIHLRINTLTALHVIGVYLDCKPTVEQANSVQARLEAKLQEITDKAEDVLLMGDLNRPMDEIRKTLSEYPIKTRISLTGPMIVARDIAHAKLKERLDAGDGLPAYLKDHPVYYAGPAKTPEGMVSGSFGPP